MTPAALWRNVIIGALMWAGLLWGLFHVAVWVRDQLLIPWLEVLKV